MGVQQPAGRTETIELGDGAAVSRLGFGTMQLTGPGVWGEPADRRGPVALLRQAADLGVTFFDTADSYGPGVAETLVADALHPYRDVLVATKGGLRRQGPRRWSKDCRPEHLRAACEESLRRLRVEAIELYQLHTVDPAVPFEESLGALVELQAEGKIRRIGVCNVTVAELERALAVVPLVSVQNRYSLAERSAEDVLAACEAKGLAFITWAPLAKGYLTRPQGRLARAGERRGATPAQVSLAWVLARSAVTLPIPGTASVEHLLENVAAREVRLRPEEVASLGRPLAGYRARALVRSVRVRAGRAKARVRGARA